MDESYSLKNMGPRLSISKAYTIPLQMQSHCLSMTPMSFEQLELLYNKVNKTQKQSKTKLDGSLKNIGANYVDTN